MPDSFLALRELSVRAGDCLTMLMAFGPAGFPTPEGRSFDEYVASALKLFAELSGRTRVPWKRQLVDLAGIEVQQAHDAFVREADSSRAEKLLRDAYDHFKEYLAGEPPRTP